MVEKQIGTEVGQKISAKSLGFDKKALQRLTLDNEGQDVFLYRVIGQAIDVQAYKSKFEDRDEEDEGFGLVGSYKITDRDGQVTEVEGILYLSGPMHQHAVSAVKAGNSVSMAVDVYVRESDKSGTGYTFINRTLIEPDRSAILEIEKNLGSTPLPALPSPKK